MSENENFPTFVPGIATEAIRLATKFQEMTAQVAACIGTTAEEAKDIMAEFMLVVNRTSLRPFTDYTATDICEWWQSV